MDLQRIIRVYEGGDHSHLPCLPEEVEEGDGGGEREGGRGGGACDGAGGLGGFESLVGEGSEWVGAGGAVAVDVAEAVGQVALEVDAYFGWRHFAMICVF